MKHENQNSSDKKPALQKHLEKRFAEIQEEGQAPEDLKKEVFDTLDTIQLVADVADLFTVKFTQSKSDLIDLVDPTNSAPQNGGTDPSDEQSENHKE